MTIALRRVGDLADQIRGVTYRKQDASTTAADGLLPILRAGNITDEGLTYKDLVFVPSSKISPKQKVMKNDIVIAASSGSIKVVGKAARALEDFEGGFGAFCKVLRPRKVVNAAYFFHFFKTPEYRRAVSFLAEGANINNLRNEDLDDLQIPLPPLTEQKRIAAILDAADALRAKRRESLAQLDTLLQSTFLDMFGDPVTNPMGWEIKALGAVGEVITGNTPPRSHAEYYGDHIEWIKSDNINNPSFFLTEAEEYLSVAGRDVARTAPAGSILVTCIAGSPSSIGNAAIADRVVAFNQQINAFVPGEQVSQWFAFGLFWVGKRLVQRASTNSMKGMVSKSSFSAIPAPVAPKSLQDQFAAIAATVVKQKTTQRAHLDELNTLFASLQSRAFRGEL